MQGPVSFLLFSTTKKARLYKLKVLKYQSQGIEFLQGQLYFIVNIYIIIS